MWGLAQRLDTERFLRGRRSGAGHEEEPFSDNHCRRGLLVHGQALVQISSHMSTALPVLPESLGLLRVSGCQLHTRMMPERCAPSLCLWMHYRSLRLADRHLL